MRKYKNIKQDRIGKKYITNEGYEIEIIEYFGANNISVKLKNGVVVCNLSFANIEKGCVRNPYHPSVCDKGFIGEGNYKAYRNKVKSSEYKMWTSMLKRCYSNRYKSYKNVTVCEEWHNFQNFAQWYNDNYNPETMQGWQLDKDILSKKCRIYSPETCCFVPREINVLFFSSNKTNNLPMGVHKDKKAYVAKCWILGKYTNLGNYDTIEKAFSIYKLNKLKEIKRVADKWKDKIEPHVYQAMYNYKIETTTELNRISQYEINNTH